MDGAASVEGGMRVRGPHRTDRETKAKAIIFGGPEPRPQAARSSAARRPSLSADRVSGGIGVMALPPHPAGERES